MTIFLVIFALGFIISMIVLASVMAEMSENNNNDDVAAHRETPQDEQQHDVKGSARIK